MVILKAISIWLLLLIAVILNAGVREKFFTPRFGELGGHQASSVMASIVFFLIVLALIKIFGFTKPMQFIILGAAWVLMTTCFEFLFGHYVMHHSWSKLLADYNIFAGRLWLLVLLTTLFSPLIAGKLRGMW